VPHPRSFTTSDSARCLQEHWVLLMALVLAASACDPGSRTESIGDAGGGGWESSDAAASGADGAGQGGGGTADAGADAGPAAASDGARDAGAGALDAARDSGTDASGGAQDAGSDAGDEGTECTRALLKSTRDAYLKALEVHDVSSLSTTPGVKFTENGTVRKLGEGFWTTAGAAKFKRSAYDVETCMSVTESVVSEKSTDIVFGLRLKLAGSQIAEVETIVARQGDYYSNPSALAKTASDDWETPVAPSAQTTRDTLKKIIDVYFNHFPTGACGFASDCIRYENGFSPGSCTGGIDCSSGAQGGSVMPPRLHVLDVEAGIAVGFVMFSGKYTDFHMFKYRDGKVHGVHATLASASTSGW
jgi:hypothetical protein